VCRSLDLEAVELDTGDCAKRPAAIVAGCLPAGARTVPADLVATFDRTDGAATLLLLAEEPLVRPVVTLNDGRIVIVACSASSTRLRSVLRMVAPDGDVKSLWRAQLSPFAWSAHARPARCSNDLGGVFAVVPFRSDAASFELSPLPGLATEDGIRRLAAHLDRDAGAVCLAPESREWIVYWPRVDRQAWLHSSVRLPHVTDLRSQAARAPGHVMRFPAHPGDVVLLLSHPMGVPPHGDPRGNGLDIASMLTEGGPYAVDRVEGAGGGLVVEVR
jgi:hypothetical protein